MAGDTPLPLPGTRMPLRAEDVIRYRTFPEWLAIQRGNLEDVLERLRAHAAWARRNWALAVGSGLIALLLLAGPSLRQRATEQRFTGEVAGMARKDVDDVLAIIGRGVRVSSLTAARLEPGVGAEYHSSGAAISVNTATFWGEPGLLDSMAHECVHAMLRQGGLGPGGRETSAILTHEVTATVLGAHLAGRVWTARGRDGAALTSNLVARFRAMCDGSPSDPRIDLSRRIFQVNQSDQVDPRELELVLTHFGNARMVDAASQACAEHSNPWEAAVAVIGALEAIGAGEPPK